MTGGHLASNLGIVELTEALHFVYDPPEDVIIWDVGHQCYAHKLLTGRSSQFQTLRQFDGISGFPRRSESSYDAYGTGHASTSISAALGFAKARDLRGSKERVVAVIGDGALTGGLAWEALNNAIHLKTDVTVVLNDNEMSICRNVGALATHLSKLRLLPLYRKVESKARDVIQNLPMGGATLSRTAEGILHGVTHLIGSETGIVFEELGFTYLGPIDGHDVDRLIEILRRVKLLHGPVLLHVLTTKGKGYEHAETNARAFHGVSSFDVKDGIVEKSSHKMTFTDAFADALIGLAEKDERIVAITAAMPDGTGLSKFAKRFPERAFDVGIAEQHAVTFAAGLAASGLKPVVAVYSTFLQRAYDQIVHDVCLQNLPVVFALDRAGLVGDDGPTHHGVFDISYLRHIPNMVVAAPSDGAELKEMLRLGIEHDGPFALRYPRGACPDCSGERERFSIGKGKVLSEGSDVCIAAIGSAVTLARQALGILKESGVSATLIDARFVKPLDADLIIESARRCGRLVLVEENAAMGGFGSSVLELLAERGVCDIPVRIVALPDQFVEQGSKPVLCELSGIDAEHIARVATDLVREAVPRQTDGG
jgi:1-deoxy-D-xylulose-5-phosphate synthase